MKIVVSDGSNRRLTRWQTALFATDRTWNVSTLKDGGGRQTAGEHAALGRAGCWACIGTSISDAWLKQFVPATTMTHGLLYAIALLSAII